MRYSNEGDLVLDPFHGLGSTGYMAIKLGRRAFGAELNPVYFDASIKYLQEAEAERSAPTLFDLDEAKLEVMA